MNLQKLFETQKVLDKHILDKHNLHGKDLLDEKVLALQVELGELANEWKMFKFWKDDPKPRTWYERECHACKGKGSIRTSIYVKEKETCGYCDGTGFEEQKNPLLEEYVDCLHLILSIGNDLNIYKCEYVELIDLTNNITAQFNSVFQLIGNWKEEYLYMNKDNYFTVVNEFLCLGKMLGFTWSQIEQAYFAKNKVNHERQEQGY